MTKPPMPAHFQAISQIVLNMTYRGLTQSELARRMDCSPSYICDILAMRRNLTPAFVKDFIRIAEMPPAEARILITKAAAANGWDIVP